MKVGWDGIKAVIGYFVGKIQTCGKQWHFPKQQKWTLSFIYLGIYRWRNSGNSVRLYFGGSKITADGDCSHEIKRRLLLGRKVMTKLDSIFKSRDITLPTKVRLVKAIHVWMWELDYKESWTPKNWCFWAMVLEKILESPLDCKEIRPVHPKGNQSWIFIGRTRC